MQTKKRASEDYYQRCGIPKGTPRRKVKGRRKRHERAVVQDVRPQVERRDGYCRLSEAARAMPDDFGKCSGPSQWSHYNATHRRSKTRGKEPEERHTTAGSMMLCTRHSEDYDQNRTDIRVLDEKRGCDGPVRATRGGAVWVEAA